MLASLFLSHLTCRLCEAAPGHKRFSVMRPWIDTPFLCLSYSLVCPVSTVFQLLRELPNVS